MSWIPEFEIGIWNAWIFIIWPIVLNILGRSIFKEKNISGRPIISVSSKFKNILNIISNASLIIGIIYSIFLPLQWNTIWFYIGLSLFLFGFILQLTALYTLRKAKSDRPFTTGPYRYSRHPIYLGLFLMIISISIMSLSWLFLLIVIIFAMPLLTAVPAEEQYCLKRYGKEYQEYMEITPRWIGLPKSGVK
ncbi:Phospholipid methyltransferase [uncultured archaeon]|nr:Phospholipid methyltransferase [uncultured archaeon]